MFEYLLSFGYSFVEFLHGYIYSDREPVVMWDNVCKEKYIAPAIPPKFCTGFQPPVLLNKDKFYWEGEQFGWSTAKKVGEGLNVGYDGRYNKHESEGYWIKVYGSPGKSYALFCSDKCPDYVYVNAKGFCSVPVCGYSLVIQPLSPPMMPFFHEKVWLTCGLLTEKNCYERASAFYTPEEIIKIVRSEPAKKVLVPTLYTLEKQKGGPFLPFMSTSPVFTESNLLVESPECICFPVAVGIMQFSPKGESKSFYTIKADGSFKPFTEPAVLESSNMFPFKNMSFEYCGV